MESNISKTAIAFNIGIKKFKKENKLSKKDMLLLLEAYRRLRKSSMYIKGWLIPKQYTQEPQRNNLPTDFAGIKPMGKTLPGAVNCKRSQRNCFRCHNYV